MNNHTRILVVGSPGSGKSTFSTKLHQITGLPLIHLDDEYWLTGWTRPCKKNWEIKLNKILKCEHWIIEGNYFSTFEKRLTACNLVIILSAPTYKCLWRAAKRGIVRYWGDTSSLPKKIRQENSPKKLSISFNFIFLILKHRFIIKPKMLKLVQKYNKECYVF